MVYVYYTIIRLRQQNFFKSFFTQQTVNNNQQKFKHRFVIPNPLVGEPAYPERSQIGRDDNS